MADEKSLPENITGDVDLSKISLRLPDKITGSLKLTPDTLEEMEKKVRETAGLTPMPNDTRFYNGGIDSADLDAGLEHLKQGPSLKLSDRIEGDLDLSGLEAIDQSSNKPR